MAFSQAGSRTWVLAATLVTLATVAVVAMRFGLSPQTPAFCALAVAGVPLALFDARTSRLPNVVTLPAHPVSLQLIDELTARHTVTYLGMPDFSASVGRASPPNARPCPP